MASQSTANDAAAPPGTAAAAANHPEDAHRPEVGSRIHSGLDNILPAAIVKRSRSGSRSSRGARSPLPVAPLLERSVSSMTDSFMLEHWGPTRSPHPETESGSVADQPSKEEEGFMPITNWAHLSYIKTQRNHLRAELKAQQIAGTEVKRSVTSLRRLAFRMAVNISVKEKQIATSARNLANSRKGSYLQGRDAEQRIESLQRALRVEECRNAEILGALEKASMLTLECKLHVCALAFMLTLPAQIPHQSLALLIIASLFLHLPRHPRGIRVYQTVFSLYQKPQLAHLRGMILI